MRAGGEASPREAKMASSSCLLRFRFFSAAQLGAESVPRRRWTNNFLPSLQSLFCPFSALQFSTRGSHPNCFIHSTLLGAEKKAKGAETEWEEKRQNKAESFFPFSLLFFSYFVVRLRLHRPELAQGLWGRHLEFLKKSSLLRARVYFSLSTSACEEEADERKEREKRGEEKGARAVEQSSFCAKFPLFVFSSLFKLLQENDLSLAPCCCCCCCCCSPLCCLLLSLCCLLLSTSFRSSFVQMILIIQMFFLKRQKGKN